MVKALPKSNRSVSILHALSEQISHVSENGQKAMVAAQSLQMKPMPTLTGESRLSAVRDNFQQFKSFTDKLAVKGRESLIRRPVSIWEQGGSFLEILFQADQPQ